MYSVLYVDDEPSLVEIAKLFLEGTNEFIVETRTSAQDGLDLIKDHSFEAIISDYQMPGMDGIVFLKAIRERFGDIPFILFTGRGREEVVIDAINNGADFYLQKGGDPTAQFAELAHKIRQAVGRRKAEFSLIESEKRLTDIIDFLPDATFAIDRSGKVIAWNRAIEEMTGVPAVDMLGKGEYEYSIPFYGNRRPILIDLIFEHEDVISKNYAHIIREKDTLIADSSLPRPKGKSVTLMGKASPLYNRQGEIVGAIESIRDITEIKRTEIELRAAYEQITASEEELRGQYEALSASKERIRESEEKFRAIFEKTHDGLVLFTEVGCIDCNQKALELYGFPLKEELLGLLPPDVSPSFQPDGQDSPSAAAAHMREVFEKGVAHFEWLHQRKDGSRFFADILLSAFELEGKPVFLSSVRDITERKLAVEAQLKSYALLQGVIESPENVVIFALDRQYRYIVFNENHRRTMKQIWGADIGLGTSMPEYIQDPEDRKKAIINFDRALSGESFTLYEAYGNSALERRWYEDTYNPIIDEKGNVIGLTLFLTDITDRKRIEEALSESEERLRLLIQQAPAALAMFDLEMRYLAASRRWMRDYHLGDRNILGRSHYEVFPEIPEKLKTIHRRGLAGEILSANEDRFEREDGSVQWLAWEVHPWHITDNVIGGIIIFSEDITVRKKVEEALHKSEERLQLAIEGSNDGLFDWNMEKNTVYYSPQYFSMLGYAMGDLPAAYSTWADLLHPDDRERALSVVNEYHEGIRENHVMEFRLRTKDGGWKWILSKAKITGRNPEGRPVRLIGTHTDITDRKQAEREIQQSRDMFRTFVDHSYDAILISDLNGRLLDTNATMLKMYHITREKALTLTIDDFSGPASLMSLEESQKIWNEVLSGKDHFFPWQARRPEDGSLFDVEVYLTRIEIENQPVVLANVRDITERKQIEDKLRESEEKYRHIIENFTDGYFQTDKDGNLSMVSPSTARMYGYNSPVDMIGLPVESLYYRPEQRNELLRILQERGKAEDFTGEARRKDGTMLWVSLSARFRVDKEGSIQGTEAIVRDITERKNMEQAIHEINRKLSLLTSITRHDVANQVSILRGYAKIAMMKKPDPVIADLLTKIDTTGSVIARQIEFTKTYQELGIHTPSWFRLDETITKVARQEVKFSNTCKHAEVFADPMLEKVFFNLFDNAIRHGERVTEIIVRCERAPDGLVVIVEDDGIGIATEEKEKIFEKGFGKNTGFGLFLAREILAITGITISETGIHGKGARFEITVPKSAYRHPGTHQKNQARK